LEIVVVNTVQFVLDQSSGLKKKRNASMKKIGLIGGTSWHSTVEYYKILNQRVNDYYENNTNPTLWIYNLNQQEIYQHQQIGQWEEIAAIIFKASIQLQDLGVDALALCANTPHKVLSQIQPKLSIPFLHIADAIGQEIKRKDLHKVGLLGTRFTMEENFIKGRLTSDYQVEVIVPEEVTQFEIHGLIVEEMSMGIFSPNAINYFQEVIQELATRGAEAVILGCTEIPLLLEGVTCTLPLIDSLASHCDLLLDFILGK
jgi:aspartate racemase